MKDKDEDLFIAITGLTASQKHSKCRGFKVWQGMSYEYDCGYNTVLDCGECKYGGGSKDPEAKRNQFKD